MADTRLSGRGRMALLRDFEGAPDAGAAPLSGFGFFFFFGFGTMYLSKMSAVRLLSIFETPADTANKVRRLPCERLAVLCDRPLAKRFLFMLLCISHTVACTVRSLPRNFRNSPICRSSTCADKRESNGDNHEGIPVPVAASKRPEPPADAAFRAEVLQCSLAASTSPRAVFLSDEPLH